MSVTEIISAAASVGLFGVGAGSALYARQQWRETRDSRKDQARPYVIVDLETSGTGPPYRDLVVRNIGATMARDVTIEFNPLLTSTLDDDIPETVPIREATLLSQPIHSMPPGKTYRFLFDDMVKRYQVGRLAHAGQYEVTISCSGPHGKEEPLTQVLDLDHYYGTAFVQVHGIHHIAKTLRAWATKDGVRNF